MNADMDRETARKYPEVGALPELEAKTTFEQNQGEHPDRFDDGQLRTLRRKVQRWRVEHNIPPAKKEMVQGRKHVYWMTCMAGVVLSQLRRAPKE